MNVPARLRALGVSEAALAKWAALNRSPEVTALGSTARPYAPYRSKWEASYAEHLEWQRFAGLIALWEYEPVKLALGGGCKYTPDFRVTLLDGSQEMHEVKGHWREAARVRIKIAADRYRQYRFVVVRKVKGSWCCSPIVNREAA